MNDIVILRKQAMLPRHSLKKVFVLGDSGVGKTSFIRVMMGETPPEVHHPTIGVTVRKLVETINNRDTITLELWEVGGRSAFIRTLSSEMFLEASLLIFMAALDDDKSIKNLKKWIQMVGIKPTLPTDPRPIMILLNKLDVIKSSKQDLKKVELIIQNIAPAGSHVRFFHQKQPEIVSELKSFVLNQVSNYNLTPMVRSMLFNQLRKNVATMKWKEMKEEGSLDKNGTFPF